MSYDSSRSAKSVASSGSSRKRGRRSSATPWGRGDGRGSANSSSTRRSPFSDFSSYMESKNRKLRDQFDADVSTSSIGSVSEENRLSDTSGDKGIFHGVSIFVDGYTVPSHQELRMCMGKHGGRFENYFSRQTVTHIICSQLPDSKMKNLRSFSRGLPVVMPAWIMDSVAAKKLLNWAPYQLDQLKANQKQQKLSAFFALKGGVGCIDSSSGQSEHFEERNSSVDLDGCASDQSLEIVKFSKCDTEGCAETSSLICRTHSDVRDEDEKVFDMEDERSVVEEHHEFQRRPSSSHGQHSTLGDPNFVDNYFKNSRLHFIGTWRNRYQKLFVSKKSSLSERKQSVNHSVSHKATIIHMDMDCFFVSVVIRKSPDLSDKPVAISHSDNAKGTAEISSANYPARQHGVRAGMFVRKAKALCPELSILPYDFNAYEEVADQFYTILHEHCPKVQAISCDEAFLDVTEINDDPEELASTIRRQIADATGCTASAGISVNMLMARLATRIAKPNGQFYIPREKVDEYLEDFPVESLPGIGYALHEKLKSHQIETCTQLRLVEKEVLQKNFGKKIGEMLWNYCRGIDHRIVHEVQEMKSIGAEVNWGIRFRNLNDCHSFLTSLCKEVSSRLKVAGMRGQTITIKVKKRKEGAGEPIKYMGCGECESMSRSMKVPCATDNEEMLTKISKELFMTCHVEAEDVRGIGLQLSRLESADIRHGGNVLESWIALAPEKSSEQKKADKDAVDISNDPSFSFSNQVAATSSETQISNLPPIRELDINVIKSLPPEILTEMNDMYHGKLSELIMNWDDKFSGPRSDHSESPNFSMQLDALSVDKGKQPAYSNVSSYKLPMNILQEEMNAIKRDNPETSSSAQKLSPHAFDTETKHATDTSSFDNDRTDLMPSSLSQVDEMMMQHLPEEVKLYLHNTLPVHRSSENFFNPPRHCAVERQAKQEIKTLEDSEVHLWIGKPPKWISLFKGSSSLILNAIADIYADAGVDNLLSSTLQTLFLSLPSLCSGKEECDDEALSLGFECLRQYIELKVDSDIEELYICFCTLRRLTKYSIFISRVYNNVLPSLQKKTGIFMGYISELTVFDQHPEKGSKLSGLRLFIGRMRVIESIRGISFNWTKVAATGQNTCTNLWRGVTSIILSSSDDSTPESLYGENKTKMVASIIASSWKLFRRGLLGF